MYQRRGRNQLLDTENIQKQFQQRAGKIMATKERIANAVEENYGLFFDLNARPQTKEVADSETQTGEATEERAVQKRRCFEQFLGLGRSVDTSEAAHKIEVHTPIGL